MRELRSLFGSSRVRKAIRQFHGKGAQNVINNFLDDFAAGRMRQNTQHQWVEYFRGRFTTAAVGANIGVFIKQLTSIPAYAMDMPVKEWLSGFTSFLSSPAEMSKAYQTLMRSPMMQARYTEGFERDMIHGLAGRDGESLTGSRTVANKMMFLVKKGDKYAIIAGGWSVYKYHNKVALSRGFSKAEADVYAMTKFEEATERTQQAGNLKDLNSYQRGGSFQRLFSMFMTAPNAYYRQWSGGMRVLKNMDRQGWRDAMAGKNPKVYDAAKRVFITQIVLPFFFTLAAAGGEWDKEEQLMAMFLGPMSGLIFFRDAGKALMNGVMGKRNYTDGLPPPMTTLEETVRFMQLGYKHGGNFLTMDPVEWLTDETMWDVIQTGGTVAGNLTGTPVGPISRTAEGIFDAARGNTVAPLRRSLGFSEKKLATDEREYTNLASTIRARGKGTPGYRAMQRQQKLNTRFNKRIETAKGKFDRALTSELVDKRRQKMKLFVEKWASKI